MTPLSPAAGPDASKPRIHVVATGGTIAGAQAAGSPHGYTAGLFTIEALIDAVPPLQTVARLTGEQLVSIGSQDMNDAVWLALARRLNELAADPAIDGVVVTHGTDTMEETAWFIALTVRTDKPIVFVGAMRPATAISADGPINLFNATALAADPAARGRGVLVVLNDTIFGARDVQKTHTSRVDAFCAPDQGPLGRIENGRAAFLLPKGTDARPDAFDLGAVRALPSVLILHAHAGMDRTLIDAAVAAKAAGLVIAGVGNGNMTELALDALQEAARAKVAVVRSTRLQAGAVLRNGEVDDDRRGFVAANMLKPGKARVLLQLALLSTRDPAAIQALFDRF